MHALREPQRPILAPQAADVAYRERFVAAVEEGLADLEAGRVVDDDELTRELDEEFGPLV
jgi:predicted transcriptional regulator